MRLSNENSFVLLLTKTIKFRKDSPMVQISWAPSLKFTKKTQQTFNSFQNVIENFYSFAVIDSLKRTSYC